MYAAVARSRPAGAPAQQTGRAERTPPRAPPPAMRGRRRWRGQQQQAS
jgi:hypothetical protein